ncbi:RNA dependent RNA polymerase-domain-containing protein [Astrocystis sublimbata]|nr:RNA dependent RNA polymerase-domain-containing protein [Astrocystis sublimbata]
MAHVQPKGFAVFMGGVPAELTDQGLRAQLQPYFDNLKIEDWACDKPRGKPFGILTFLHPQHGHQFLNNHGERPIPGASYRGKPKTRAYLHLLGKPVFCKKSDKEADSMLLRVLETSAEERLRAAEDVEESPKLSNVVFRTFGISCGHYSYAKDKLEYTPDIQWPTKEGTAKFARNMLIVSFSQGIGQIRVEIPYRIIYEVVVSGKPTSLFLTLWEPPRIFLLSVAGELTALFRNLGTNRNPMAPRSAARERLSKIPHNDADHSEVIGQSLIYSLTLSPEDFASKLERLRENDYLELSTYNVPILSHLSHYMTHDLTTFKSMLSSLSRANAPFDLLYQFHALVQNGYLPPRIAIGLLVRLCNFAIDSQRNVTSISKVPANSSSPLPFSGQAVKKLISQMPFPGPHTEAKMFDEDEIWSQLKANEKEIQQGLTKSLLSERARHNLTMVYKVQVTPTSINFNGPEPEAKNRILRKFPNHTDYFARVQFCDEDGQDIYFNPKVSLEIIYSRFKTILLDGFKIGRRLYKFLGFSHSSLRAHAVWFMASFVDDNGKLQSYDTVIPELGDFEGIRAARIGQAFSETPTAINLEDPHTRTRTIPDVKSEDGSRVFSDGVGTLSRELLEDILYPMPQKASTATCVQIRWGGAKGMLSLDDTLEGRVMSVRDSMIKFQSRDTQNLEICDVANKPIPLVLNRQMIKILEDMQVPEAWFFKGQNKELDRLRKITANTTNTVEFLRRQKIAEQLGFSQFIRRLQNLNLDYKKDAFLCSVVEAVVLSQVRLLKYKSRIPVEQGVTLFGVMDEFQFLEEDEVFITFDKQKGVPYPDLDQRLVIVTRSPGLHPGDIQMRRAVVPPRNHPLRSLTNCIAFSQKGDRDLPSQLSGGDLDGDIFNVIWDSMAVNGCQREFAPADYPRVTPLDIGRTVKARDMTDFFVTFMATDQLGLIATRHIILADMHEAGTVHDECQVLAEMHSTAVDYSKTGIPVEMGKMATLTRTKYRPDFLALAPPTHIVDKTEIYFEAPIAPSNEEDEDDETGPRHRFYASTNILGKLYRAIDEKRIWDTDIHLTVNRHGMTLWDELFIHVHQKCDALGGVNWQRALNEAQSIRQAYEDMVREATIAHSEHASRSITELEVFIGDIFNKIGIQNRRQRDTSLRLKDEFDRITKWVEGLIRKRNVKAPTDLPDRTGEDLRDVYDDNTDSVPKFTALEMSIACFRAGLSRRGSRNVNKRSTDDFASFKVIAAHCALRELEIAKHQKDIADGAAFMSGGFPGVKSGEA